MIYEKWLFESFFHLLFFGFEIYIDMDNEVVEDDDINLESFGDERDAPPRFRDKNHPIEDEDEDEENENEDEDDDNDASGSGAFGSHDYINFSYLYDNWGLCCYQMNLKT